MVNLRRTACLTLLAVLLLAPFALAAKPTTELLRLVPQDAALCLIVQDIRGNTRRLAESPFIAQLRKSPLGNLIPEEAAVRSWPNSTSCCKRICNRASPSCATTSSAIRSCAPSGTARGTWANARSC